MKLVYGILVGAVLALAGTQALAIGSQSSAPVQPTAAENFKAGKNATYAGRHNEAIRLMQRVVKAEPRNADAHNYLGFNYRKMGKLDLAAKSYTVALGIDPNHKGALEYQGEMFLKMNDLTSAQANRAKLAGLCPSGCKELAELDRAIADFTATRKGSS